MQQRTLVVTRTIVAVAFALAAAAASAGAQLPTTVDPLGALRTIVSRGELVGAQRRDYARLRPSLQRLYAGADARLLWTAGGVPTAQAESLVAALGSAAERGLRAADYDADALASSAVELARKPADDDGAALRFEGSLSLAAMRLMTHLHRGRVDPGAVGFALPADRTSIDLASLTRQLATANAPRAVLDALDPPFARFAALRRVLARYRALAADPSLALPPYSRRAIRPGDAWAGVPALARYLAATGDLSPDVEGSDTLTAEMVEGVRRFQRHHGLEPDGVIGPATMAQLRVPLAARVRQIELTLERWRWLPHDMPPRLAVVNIPGFRLYLFDRDGAAPRPTLRLDVIVGRAYGKRRTPVFAGTMREVVFHPFWDVPPSIARREEIPHIRRDPDYAEREGMEIVRGGDVGARIYAMTYANMDRVAAGELRLRQRPGPGNALGAVKFVFPNDYNVYLHGTPARSLFAYARRDFSHGCIRVSDPPALARFVLAGQSGWDSTRIATAMSDSTGLLRVKLERPLPVYVLYATVVPDDADVPYFYPDLYGHDAALARLLGMPSGAPTIAWTAPPLRLASRDATFLPTDGAPVEGCSADGVLR